MAEEIAPRRRRVRAFAIVAFLATACAPLAAPPRAASPLPPPAEVPAEAVLTAFADLIRLEDRREFNARTLLLYAAAPDPRVRARAALALGRFRESAAAPILLPLISDSDSSVAATAAFSLGQLGDSSYAVALTSLLADSSVLRRPTVGAEAAYALGKVGGLLSRDSLIAFLARRPLQDPAGGDPAGSALLAIWKLPAAADVAAVARWLEAPDAELRWRSAYALSRRPDARALTLLRRSLSDSDPRVRSLALRGLTAALADSAGVAQLELVEEIVPLLRDSAYIVAVNAARTLGSYSTPQAVDALRTAAASADDHLRIAALESLGRIGPQARGAAQGIAVQARADSLPVAVRAAALDALVRIDSVAAAPAAGELSAAPGWRLRAAAARAFAMVQGSSGAAVQVGLRDPDPRVANAALQALIEAAGDSLSPLRPLLVEQLGAGDPIVRATALSALARLAEPTLLPALLDAYGRAQRDTLNDAALAAVDAIAAVEQEGTRPSRPFFARFRRSPDPLVRVRVSQRFDSATVARSWGDPLPVEGNRSPAEYRQLVDVLVAPALAGDSAPTVALVTEGDTLLLRLFPLEATLTVESFLRLAESGYFDGQQWPRVVPNFVVQGGDPRGDTSGGPGYSIRDEINRHRYGTGTIGMALAGPDTGGSQFFITHSPQPHLDGTYGVFGRLIRGRPVTERILPAHTIERIRRMD